MKPTKQNQFGGPNGEIIGNCFPACIASLLECDLSEVPHFHQLHRDPNDALDAMLAWLVPRGFTIICHDWAPWCTKYMPGALVIFGGKSPRGDWSHAVIGEVTSDGWRLVHDPHPDGTGIVGEPKTVEILIPLLRRAA